MYVSGIILWMKKGDLFITVRITVLSFKAKDSNADLGVIFWIVKNPPIAVCTKISEFFLLFLSLFWYFSVKIKSY